MLTKTQYGEKRLGEGKLTKTRQTKSLLDKVRVTLALLERCKTRAERVILSSYIAIEIKFSKDFSCLPVTTDLPDCFVDRSLVVPSRIDTRPENLRLKSFSDLHMNGCRIVGAINLMVGHVGLGETKVVSIDV